MKKRVYLKMDKNQKKSGLLLLCTLLLAFVVAACSPAATTESLASTPESLAGYIVLEENKLYLDEVEIVTLEDENRMAELDLNDKDLPNGYYIHNANEETKIFELTGKTEYTFTDINLLFVEDADGDRLYTTTKKEDFIQHLNTIFGRPAGGNVPFFIEVKDGKVVSITEKFIFTQ